MKIVILDGATTFTNGLDYQAFEALKDAVYYPRTQPSEIVSRAKDADIVLTNKVVLTREILSALPKLKLIQVTATGVNTVDLDACLDLGISVCNVPSYSTASVAQLVFSYILADANRVELHSASVHRGEYSQALDFCYTLTSQREIEGKTLGLIGFGAISQAVARLAQAFNMRVSVHNRSEKIIPGLDVNFVSRETLLHESDYVSLHIPYQPSFDKMVNESFLRQMKKGAFLINTARGGLVDEVALKDALVAKHLRGAALDVLRSEPPKDGSVLFGLDNCIITPHMAWATEEARLRMVTTINANIMAFNAGKRQNTVGVS